MSALIILLAFAGLALAADAFIGLLDQLDARHITHKDDDR
jgi:hypothetical protein